MNECTHDVVTRGEIHELDGEPIWTCTECAAQFIPVQEDLI